MSIRLTPEAEALIIQKVESGLYPSTSDVVEEAVRLLDERDRQRQQLREKLQIGLDELERGEGSLLTPALLDEIDREVEARFHRGELPHPDVCP